MSLEESLSKREPIQICLYHDKANIEGDVRRLLFCINYIGFEGEVGFDTFKGKGFTVYYAMPYEAVMTKEQYMRRH